MTAAPIFEFPSIAKTSETSPASLTPRILRLWSAPELILAVTDLADEDVLLFHAIRQARRCAARVLLAHVLPADRSRNRTGPAPAISGSFARHAQQALERMARQLRWVGIACEPILLRGEAGEEILTLAKARGVDRVLLTAWRDRSPLSRSLAEEISPWVGVPVCVVRNGGIEGLRNERPSGHIALALSLRSDCETALSFAGRLAQQYGAALTVMHVFTESDPLPTARQTPSAIAARIPSSAVHEAGLLCPLDFAAFSGDPAAEILKVEAATSFDFLLLGAPQSPYTDQPGAGVVHRIVGQARCPVILLGHRATQMRVHHPPPEVSVPA